VRTLDNLATSCSAATTTTRCASTPRRSRPCRGGAGFDTACSPSASHGQFLEIEAINCAVRGPGFVDFTAAGFETVTIEHIITANGPRIPAPPNAPRHFELGLVILAGAALSAEEWTFYERTMDFVTAQDARRIDESFAAEQFRAERALWQATEKVVDGTILNFFTATGQRATLGLSPPSV
jgi:hypothetical protein